MQIQQGLYNPILAGTVPVNVTNGFGIGPYDYISLTAATLTDTYVFKLGGAGGTTVNTLTITYTDSGKGTISTVAKT